jgi:hypothetical protein
MMMVMPPTPMDLLLPHAHSWDSFYHGKTVVVTGAGGFIGSHLVEALVRLGAKVKADGVTHAILVPLYPHYSLATIGSSLREWTQVLEQPEHYAYAKGLQQSTLCSHYEHPLFLQAVAETIHTALVEKPWNCPPEDVLLVFSAHGLPVDYVHNNKDPYPRQIKATIDALIAQHFPKNQWQLCCIRNISPISLNERSLAGRPWRLLIALSMPCA